MIPGHGRTSREPNSEHEIAFEAFGVRAALSANRPELVERLRPLLPPGWQPCAPSDGRAPVRASPPRRPGPTRLTATKTRSGQGLELELALTMLDSQLRLYVGVEGPRHGLHPRRGRRARGQDDRHARASFAGKTTLVAALVDAGATYYSDEFAVIDERGPRPPLREAALACAATAAKQTDHSAREPRLDAGLGAAAARHDRGHQLPAGRRMAAAAALVRRGSDGAARKRGPGAGAARSGDAGDLPRADDAIVIESERGEADELAPLLLAELERLTV